MVPTKLSYMTDQQALSSDAVVIDARMGDDGRIDLVLDRTLFYPRGGGQESDRGVIQSASGVFHVQDVRFQEGLVHHYGALLNGTISAGDMVTCNIDAACRSLNSRLHSAGHLIDESVRALGLEWNPTKGIHYPGNSAVEYKGSLSNDPSLAARIEVLAQQFIDEGYEVQAKLVDANDVAEHATFVPPDLPSDKPIRVVTVWGDKGVPCGGTHVANIKDIGGLKIRYVKARKGDIKIAYELVDA